MFGDRLDWFLNENLGDYFGQNNITLEKIDYVERELNVHLFKYKLKYYLSHMFYL